MSPGDALFPIIARFREYLILRKRQGYLRGLQARGMKLGQDVTIQDGFFLDPSHCYLIEIQSFCTLAPNVRLIAHDASTKRFMNATRLGRIVIEEGCFIGDSVIILPGVTIGNGSIIGAGSVVTRSIAPRSVAVGNPAKVLCTVAEYLERVGVALAAGRYFGPEYSIERASPSQIREIVAACDLGPTFIN